MANGDVSVLMGTKNPRIDWLTSTLRSLEWQTVKPKEVIIVDSSDEPLEVEYERARVINEDVGLGDARAMGLRNATSKYVIHIDEDAILAPDYLERGIENMKKPGVSGVGGVVYPIDGSLVGSVVASFENATPSKMPTHHIMHERMVCPEGNSCISHEHRNEDISIRHHLSQYGDIVRDSRMIAFKEIPTRRESIAINMIAFAGVLWLGERIAESSGSDEE